VFFIIAFPVCLKEQVFCRISLNPGFLDFS
jgi:hypothetical protein